MELTHPLIIIILKSNSKEEASLKNKSWLFQVLIFLTFVLFLPGLSLAQELELQVVVQKANIRAKPDLNSAIVVQVSAGTVLKSDKQEGNWYRVILPPDETGANRLAYIHNSVVEVITKSQPVVEKKAVVKAEEKPAAPKKKEEEKALSVQPQQLAPKPRRSGGMEFGLRLQGGYDFFRGRNTINDGWLGYNDYANDYGPLILGMTIDGELEPLRSGYNAGGEFFLNINPFIGFGLGFGYLFGNEEGAITATNTITSLTSSETFAQKISVPYARITVYGGLPLGKSMRLVPFIGGGLYYGAITIDYQDEVEEPLAFYEAYYNETWTAYSTAFGFHGGLNFEIHFTRNIGLFVGAGGLVASFKDLVADSDWTVWDNYGTSDSGTYKDLKLWSVEADYFWLGLGEYPSYSLNEDEPLGIGVMSVEPGVISVSQFRVVVGIVVYFTR